jgi:hypothetical protein
MEGSSVRRRISSIAAAVALLAITAGNVMAVGTLDQQQTNTSGYTIDWLAPDKVAQTFTAEITGKLDTVAVNGDAFGKPATVQILSSGGSTVVDSQTAALTSNAWTQISLATPPSVTKGSQYWIVLAGPTEIAWNGDCTNSYGGGEAKVYESSTSSWYTVPGWWATFGGGGTNTSYCAKDYAFKTYVTPPPAPTPSPTKKPTPKPTVAPTPPTTPSPTATATPTAMPTASPLASAAPIASQAASPSMEVAGLTSSNGGSGSTPTLPLVVGGAVVVGLLGLTMALLLLRRRGPSLAAASAMPGAVATPAAGLPPAGPQPATPPLAGAPPTGPTPPWLLSQGNAGQADAGATGPTPPWETPPGAGTTGPTPPWETPPGAGTTGPTPPWETPPGSGGTTGPA